MSDILKRRFDLAMLEIYRRAKLEANYNATYFLRMLEDHGGVLTAKKLINLPTVSEGYTALYMLGRLDLTMEAMIFDNPEWQELFTDKELEIVRQHLIEYRYGPALGSE